MLKKLLRYKLLLILCLLPLSGTASAETRYVVDQLIITLRTGQSNQHQILKTLPSGTALELLEDAGNYSRVRTPDGIEGWVLTQYISSTPTAKQRLAAAEKRLAEAEALAKRLQTELDATKRRENELLNSQDKLTQQQQSQSDELERLRRISAQPLKLEQENQQMKKDLLELENDYKLLRQEHQLLSDSSEREWFLTGAGVIILGILIGLIAPKFQRRKKSSW